MAEELRKEKGRFRAEDPRCMVVGNARQRLLRQKNT